MGPDRLAGSRVEEALAALADPEHPPAAGVATALTAATAAALEELSGGLAAKRLARRDAAGAARQRELSERAAVLRRNLLGAADADVDAYGRVLAAEGSARAEALADAAEPPARVADHAAEVAEGAAETAEAAGGWPFQPDAVAASILAAAAARGAAGLVAANLASQPADDRIARAAADASRAEAAAARARQAAESASTPAPE